ncbi:nuclear apoptosis-inducing factor 1-like [Argopecten irradians]|uniref:nuclear apoptosis-inducing factor 1-like n=1 Tax=Argopecten irradians TaxID=31199 RepID=UPI0037173FE4
MENKMKRRPNFTETECQTLAELAIQHIDIIQCKFSSTVTIKKADVWQQITDSINAISPTTRSRDEIKKKWQDMVGETRKRESARMMMQRQTGGGSAPKPLSQMQEQILTVISKAFIVGIEGVVESSMEGIYNYLMLMTD